MSSHLRPTLALWVAQVVLRTMPFLQREGLQQTPQFVQVLQVGHLPTQAQVQDPEV